MVVSRVGTHIDKEVLVSGVLAPAHIAFDESSKVWMFYVDFCSTLGPSNRSDVLKVLFCGDMLDLSQCKFKVIFAYVGS